MTSRDLPALARALLWTDGLAGATVGVLVLALHGWLAELYGMSPSLVLALGAANLAYGSYSTTLAVRMHRGVPPSRRAVDVLVAANGAWAVFCVVLALVLREHATVLGLAVIVLEGVFVGGLGVLERRYLRPHVR